MLRRIFAVGCSAAVSTVDYAHTAPGVGSEQKRPTIAHKLGVLMALGEKPTTKEIHKFVKTNSSSHIDCCGGLWLEKI